MFEKFIVRKMQLSAVFIFAIILLNFGVGLLLAIAHEQFLALNNQETRSFCKDNCVIYHFKSELETHLVDGASNFYSFEFIN